MDFYAIYGVQPYTDPPVFPVYYNPTLRTTSSSVVSTTSTSMIITSTLLLSTLYSSVPTTTGTNVDAMTTVSSTSSMSTFLTSSMFSTYKKAQKKIPETYVQGTKIIPDYYGKKIFRTTKRKYSASTRDPYHIRDPWTATIPYSTRFEPKIIFSWTRTTSPSTLQVKGSSIPRNLWSIRTTWPKEKIIGGQNIVESSSTTPKVFSTRRFSPLNQLNQFSRRRFVVRTTKNIEETSTKGFWRALKKSTQLPEFISSKINEVVAEKSLENENPYKEIAIIFIIMFVGTFAGIVVFACFNYFSRFKNLKIKLCGDKKKKSKVNFELRKRNCDVEIISIGEDIPLNSPEVKTTFVNVARHFSILCALFILMLFTF